MTSSKTIGIIGGGQLGQMMAISAIYMGHKVITLDPQRTAQPPKSARSLSLPITMWRPSNSWRSGAMS